MNFVADEIMVDVSKGIKCITPGRITVDIDHLPYISAMCANNIIGAILPRFVISPHHSTAMPEFNDIQSSILRYIPPIVLGPLKI
jgi:hypothetical protein